MLIFRRTIVLVQHLVSSFSLGDCSVHRLREDSRDGWIVVRIPPGAWISASCECCVLSSRGLCNGPILSPEESYRVCVCITECDKVQQ